MATWTAQGAGDFGAFTGGKSTIWSSDGGTTWLGDGGADTFLLYNNGHRTDTFVLKTATVLSIGTGVSDLIYATAINGAGTGTVTIGVNCTINAALTAGTAATFLVNANTPSVTIAGTVTGGAGGNDDCVAVSVAGTLTVTGNVTGGSGAAAFGINVSGGGVLNITGTVTGGSNSSASGIGSTTGASTITINGSVVADAASALGIASSSACTLTITGGNITDTGTVNAILLRAGTIVFVPGAANYYRMRTTGSATVDLIYDVPDVANVRATDTVKNVAGSIATQTLSPANDTVAAGYYAATTLSAVDADLAVGNIVSGKTIFGFAGEAAGGAGGLLTHPGMAGGMRG